MSQRMAYHATWILVGKDAFWNLVSCFTQGLIRSACTLGAFKYEGDSERASIAFTIYADVPQLVAFNAEALEEVEKTQITLGGDAPAPAPASNLRQFRACVYTVGADGARKAVNALMRGMILYGCRLEYVEGGANERGAYLDCTAKAPPESVDQVKAIICNCDLNQ